MFFISTFPTPPKNLSRAFWSTSLHTVQAEEVFHTVDLCECFEDGIPPKLCHCAMENLLHFSARLPEDEWPALGLFERRKLFQPRQVVSLTDKTLSNHQENTKQLFHKVRETKQNTTQDPDFTPKLLKTLENSWKPPALNRKKHHLLFPFRFPVSRFAFCLYPGVVDGKTHRLHCLGQVIDLQGHLSSRLFEPLGLFFFFFLGGGVFCFCCFLFFF